MPCLRLLLCAVFVGCLASCAPYAERLKANLGNVYVSKWVRLTSADREAIAALIARVEKIETLVGISERNGEFTAFTGRITEGYGGSHKDYSVYDIGKIGGEWKVLRKGDDISPFIIRTVLHTPQKGFPKDSFCP